MSGPHINIRASYECSSGPHVEAMELPTRYTSNVSTFSFGGDPGFCYACHILLHRAQAYHEFSRGSLAMLQINLVGWAFLQPISLFLPFFLSLVIVTWTSILSSRIISVGGIIMGHSDMWARAAEF